MGILNLTDDSFFDGGSYNTLAKAMQRAEQIHEEGAKIIDLGACSTRPGAKLISPKEEIQRLIPCVKAIRKTFPHLLISIDTVWAEVCRAAVGEGADIINDISGGAFDHTLFPTIGQLRVPYVLMHTNGTPDHMQQHTQYDDLYLDICKYFAEKIQTLKAFGVHDLIIDLGFGFAKTLNQNYTLLRRLQEFEVFDLPILVGVSRKSMIYKTLGISAEESLNGTTVLNTLALQTPSVKILRVHDVKAAHEAIQLVQHTKSIHP